MVNSSDIIAAGALALGVYNFVHGLREPVRAKQREVRGQLLQLLHEVAGEWLQITSQVAAQHGPRPRDAPRSRAAITELHNLGRLLKYPGHEDFRVLASDLSQAVYRVRELDSRFDKDAVLNSDELQDVIGELGPVLVRVEVAIDVISKKERGALRNKRMYPYEPLWGRQAEPGGP